MLDLSAFVRVPQAAEELSVHPETVRRLLRQGTLPGSKAGTLWFIAKRDLRRFKEGYDPRPGPKRQESQHAKQ